MSKICFVITIVIPLISLILSNPINNDQLYGCGAMNMNIDMLLKISE